MIHYHPVSLTVATALYALRMIRGERLASSQSLSDGAEYLVVLLWALEFARFSGHVMSGHVFILPKVLSVMMIEALWEAALLGLLVLTGAIGRSRIGLDSRLSPWVLVPVVAVLMDRSLSVTVFLGNMALEAKAAGMKF